MPTLLWPESLYYGMPMFLWQDQKKSLWQDQKMCKVLPAVVAPITTARSKRVYLLP